MSKQKAGYEALFEQVTENLKHSPDEVKQWVETSENYLDAASDMSKDEWALIAVYLKRDLKEFSENYEQSKETFPDSPFYRLIADSIWQGLAEITDKTRIEWFETFEELDHQGIFQAGEVIGLGVLECEKCANKTEYNHACIITPCTKCGHDQFTRQSLRP